MGWNHGVKQGSRVGQEGKGMETHEHGVQVYFRLFGLLQVLTLVNKMGTFIQV